LHRKSKHSRKEKSFFHLMIVLDDAK
jgi:hypothetical protein